MRDLIRTGFTRIAAIVAMLALFELATHAQSNRYRVVENWAQLPDGLKFGQVMAVYPGPDGSIYAFHRCGSDTCVGRTEPAVLRFDQSGKLLKSWGESMFVWPHGLYVDRNGFVWVTDKTGNSVTRIDPATGAGVAVDGVGNGPSGIAAGSEGVWFTNSRDGTVARIDPRNAKVVQTVRLGFSPEGIAVGGGAVWVALHSR